MALLRKINPASRANPDTGFGVQGNQIGGRFINKDGSFNLRKEGLPLLKRISIYSNFLDLSWYAFFAFILLFYFMANIAFTCLYLLAGVQQLQGITGITTWARVREVFFFSTETFTTVGYGRINPVGDLAHIISSMESMTGFLSFAVLTGLLYGRFSRPKAYIAFSDNLLVSPYRDGGALMFRMVPYKSRHHITDARISANITFLDPDAEKPEYRFYQLKLERNKVDTFTMNWTVVHPIDEESPLLNFTEDDFRRTDMELYVQVTGFDHIFSSTVLQRTSYTFKELVWGAKFLPMYHESADGAATILKIDKLNDFATASLNR